MFLLIFELPFISGFFCVSLLQQALSILDGRRLSLFAHDPTTHIRLCFFVFSVVPYCCLLSAPLSLPPSSQGGSHSRRSFTRIDPPCPPFCERVGPLAWRASTDTRREAPAASLVACIRTNTRPSTVTAILFYHPRISPIIISNSCSTNFTYLTHVLLLVVLLSQPDGLLVDVTVYFYGRDPK